MAQSDFTSIKIKLASPEEILSWSRGEVTKPETINYRTQRPEKDGLFSEVIFGPTKDWECYCGKYKRIRYKGVVCDKCGVEVTRSIVRRERMGHIKLAIPVSHVWFLRGVPSKMGLLLDISVQDLEKVIYFSAYIITKVYDGEKEKILASLEKEYATKLKAAGNKEEKTAIKESYMHAKDSLAGIRQYEILSEVEHRELSLRYSTAYEAGMGAEALRKLFTAIDLYTLRDEVTALIAKAKNPDKKQMRRLRLVEGMIKAGIRPEWMFMTVLPVIPPDLRPMVALDGGRFATSDVNDLYRRVINRNNRLKKLMEINAPEVITRNEKRMLQEAVDALIDNSVRHGQQVMASSKQKRPLKSLADMLRGKSGRFRQNLLGKRVDYSGRSVIVVGPQLQLHECGLPKKMALELFKPFIIHKLIYEYQLAHNVRSATRLIEQGISEVWDALDSVIQNRYVLLNRAPTLHRLGIQAFKPVLVEGKSIQLHPLVCSAFNADFDGDQMAVHLPLSDEAQREAADIMVSSHNLLKPASGETITEPSKDMVFGIYWITGLQPEAKGSGKAFYSSKEAIFAQQAGEVDLRASIKVRLHPDDRELTETSVGRILFNHTLPDEIGFVNQQVKKKDAQRIVSQIVSVIGFDEAAKTFDRIKDLSFHFATISGISWGMADLTTPTEKKGILDETQKEVDLINKDYENGYLTNYERKSKVIETWENALVKIGEMVPKTLHKDGSAFLLVDSGARGAWQQVTQMAGIKGLVINPSSEIIELPIKNSFKEGLNVLEYFISTHGTRKGTTDTALKTSVAGYLTRRLVDVSQDLIIREEDCGSKEGVALYLEDESEWNQSLGARAFGRVLAADVKDAAGNVAAKRGEFVTKEVADAIDAAQPSVIKARSPITCKSTFGMCKKCYGLDLGKNKMVELGTAVGIITAQSIGEPGTQLTMRTFHTGGIAMGGDITMGLPRVEEIFEARNPKGRAPIATKDGVVTALEEQGQYVLIKVADQDQSSSAKAKKAGAISEYQVPALMTILVKEGDFVAKGTQLSEGHLDLNEVYEISGKEAVIRYITKEVQSIYKAQGAKIDDKYIEIIIKQMFARTKIKDAGDTDLLIGSVVEKGIFDDANAAATQAGKKPAKGEELLLGITRSALSTNSFLSAASFQETTRVLIDAAIEGREDDLRGLKENVIIGRLIPAGTGFATRMAENE